MFDEWLVVANGRQRVEDIRKASENQLSGVRSNPVVRMISSFPASNHVLTTIIYSFTNGTIHSAQMFLTTHITSTSSAGLSPGILQTSSVIFMTR